MKLYRSIAYQIVSCAQSPLEAYGFPFAVIVGETTGNYTRLEGFALRNWPEQIDFLPGDMRETLELFLSDLKSMCGSPREDSTHFLKSLAELSMGPIRSFASGFCEDNCLINVLNTELADVPREVRWPTSFIRL